MVFILKNSQTSLFGEADNQQLSYTVKDAPGKYFRLNMINQKMVSKLSPVLILSQYKQFEFNTTVAKPVQKFISACRYNQLLKKNSLLKSRNTAGSLLQQKHFDAVNGMNLIQIPVENLAKGIYFIRVIHSQTGESQVFKGIKE